MFSNKYIWLLGLLMGVGYFLHLSNGPLFNDDVSKVVYDRDGQLLGASIASDGQWRFPASIDVPRKFAQAVLLYEDHRYFFHRGIDLIAVGRAIYLNVKHGKIISGASTITMQVSRMSRKNKPRNFLQKGIETVMAILLEMKESKKEILSIYASHAPFGGNVVGLNAASWRYFGKRPEMLTWAESAALAVLPNAPGLIHPGRNRSMLLQKRNELLHRLHQEKVIDSFTLELSLLEPIPDKPYPLPRKAPHLMDQLGSKVSEFRTTIDGLLQDAIVSISDDYYRRNTQKGIENHGILVVDNLTGEVISYVGNSRGHQQENHVDMVLAKRSSGSILKPFLYASMMQTGKISPDQLLSDVPTSIGGFNPKNYNKSYAGAVKASTALARSLNVPAVLLLKDYGVEAFRQDLTTLGFSTLHHSADYYGLSLILGGGEVTLWELVDVYSRCAQKLLNYQEESKELNIHFNDNYKSVGEVIYDEGVIYSMFNAMKNVVRPDSEGGWQYYQSSIPLAWKTGTSYGHRDAWAVGVTPDYTIGVWVGNSDGEGRPEVVGSSAAGSILFSVLHTLPVTGGWFDIPYDEMIEAPICVKSGHIKGKWCEEVDTLLIPAASAWAPACHYHELIYINEDKKRVHIDCSNNYRKKSWFHLPPDMAYYYQRDHADYEDLPPLAHGCEGNNSSGTIALLYPSSHESIFIPQGLNGENKAAVFKATHRMNKSKIFWHLDGRYLGDTYELHQMKIQVPPGKHKIKLIDTEGNEVNRTFEVVGE